METELTEKMTTDNRDEDASSTKDRPGVSVGRVKWWTRQFIFLELLVYGSPNRTDVVLLVVGVIAAIAAGVPFPLMGILFGQLVDSLNSATCSEPSLVSRAAVAAAAGENPQAEVNAKVLLVVYLAIAYFGLIYIYIVCFSLFGERLSHRLRTIYFSALLRQEVGFFDTELPPGEVASRLSGDIALIKAGTSEKVGVWIYSMSFFVTAYVVAFIKEAKLAGMLVSLVPAFMIMSLVGGHYIEKFASNVTDHMASAAAIALEGLSHVMVVQAFRANKRLEGRFAVELSLARREGIKKAVASALQSGILYFVAYCASGLAFWQGSRGIADAADGTSDVSVGSTYTVIFILVDASLILSQVSPYLQIFGSAAAAFGKLRQSIERPSKIDGTVPTQGKTQDAPISGEMVLRNLSFAYPSRPEAPVFRNLSLDIPASKHTAIIGLSGSGKSTIAGLLTRLYDPQEGTITLDGQDICNINVRHLRSIIGLVQQDALLFDRSILENIAQGLVNSPLPSHLSLKSFLLGPGLAKIARALQAGEGMAAVSQAAGKTAVEVLRLVQRAAELADVTTFAPKLAHGLATNIGFGGERLSGGQKARVALARALVKDPKILILDEATASLDSATELRIQGAVNKIAAGRTLITIAHRLTTIRDAHNIYVMQAGDVIESGTHDELVSRHGHYASLVSLQNNSHLIHDDSEEGRAKTHKLENSIKKNGTSIDNIDPEPTVASMTATAVDDGGKEDSGPEPTESSSSWSATGRIASIMRPYSLWLLPAFTGAIIVGGSYSGEAVIFGHTVRALSPCQTPSSIRSAGNFYGLMFFVLALVEFFANMSSWSAFGYMAEKTLYTVRLLSFRALFNRDLNWHQSENRTPSGLLGYLTTDSNALGGLTGSVIGTAFSILINLVAAIILTHIIAWKIALVCLAVVPLMLGTGFMQMRELARFEEKHEAAFARSIGITVEAITSIKAVAALSLEDEVLNSYRRALRAPQKGIVRACAFANLWLAIAYSIGNLVYALAYWWGAKRIIAGDYTQEQFFIVILALLVSAQLWSQMFTLAPEVSKARLAILRIGNLLRAGKNHCTEDDRGDEEAVIQNTTSRYEETLGATAVKFDGVHFAYPARPEQEILKGLNIEIRPGQFCALVGPSGAGKSTILSLLERMYPTSGGSIYLDNVDISAREDPAFRDYIGLVPQSSVLFDGSIKFNVALGARPGLEPSGQEIEDACRLANIHDTIVSLPDGYDTTVGCNGGQLSGGQKQRLSIARALVRRPRLLLLDEPSSALDSQSERLLQDGLNCVQATGQVTILVIAHRLQTIRRADVIFLIEDGRCVECGSHDELMTRSESYRDNVMHQTLRT